jgi:hypothetical protein
MSDPVAWRASDPPTDSRVPGFGELFEKPTPHTSRVAA